MTGHDTTGAPHPSPSAAERAIRQHLRRMRFTLSATDPAAGTAIDSARHHLAGILASAAGTLSRAPLGGAAATAMDSEAAAAKRCETTGAPENEPVNQAGTITLAAAALAALELGDFEAAPRVIRLLGEQQIDGRELTPLYLLLLSRHLAWTGTISILREEWPRVLDALAWRSGGAAGETGHPATDAWQLALQELALAAESIGEQGVAEGLRDELQGVAQSGAGDSPDGSPPPGASPAADAVRRAFAAEPGPPPADDAAGVVAHYLRGVLGVVPDAPQNRLVMRPRLPEGWTDLRIEGLRFGDAELGIGYRREENRHRFTFVQESGAVPVRLIFEPLLPARGLAGARVDGQPALLEPRPHEGRLMVPIQIVLDDERVVELEGGGRGGERTRISLPVR